MYNLTDEEKEYLKTYDASAFERPSVTTDILAFTIADDNTENYRKNDVQKLKILMVKRKGYPFKDYWALPGGFLNMSESLDECALRELQEETGNVNPYIEQLYTYGSVDRDPRTRVLSTVYLSLIPKDEIKATAGDDAAETAWFSLESEMVRMSMEPYNRQEVWNLTFTNGDIEIKETVTKKIDYSKRFPVVSYEFDSKNIAFDHLQIILYGLERIRNKIEYTDIAKYLLAEEFTLFELQEVYEIILGKKLVTPNFRRKISDKIEGTNNVVKGKGHRPTQKFRFI